MRRLFKVVNKDAHYKPFIAYQDVSKLPLNSSEPQIAYRERIKTALQSDGKGASATECLLFHGTTRACLVGEDDAISGICNLPRCALCRIIENSFDVKFCGSQHKFKRSI